MNDDVYQRRGTLGILVLSVPVVAITLTGLAYGVLFWYGNAGRAADGPVTRVDFAGCPEAMPLVRARAEQMGLPDLALEPSADGFTLTARFPEAARVQETLPGTLAGTGSFAVRPLTGDIDGELLLTHAAIASAGAYLPFLDAPKVHIQLDVEGTRVLHEHMRTHPDDAVGYWLDGVRVTTRRNMPPEERGGVTLDLTGRTDLERMDFAASAAIQLQHGPLPCTVSVRSAVPISAP